MKLVIKGKAPNVISFLQKEVSVYKGVTLKEYFAHRKRELVAISKLSTFNVEKDSKSNNRK